MKFLRPGFWQKIVIVLILLFQLALLIGLLVWLVNSATSMGPTFLNFFILGIFILDVIVSIFIISSSSPDIYRLTWIFAVFALPIAGTLMYLFLANKATSARNRRRVARYARPIEHNPSLPGVREELEKTCEDAVPIQRYLEAAYGGGIHKQTSVEYFPIVDLAFEPILRELKKAKHYIFLEFFILARGVFLDSILDILKEKVKEGVDVRLIYDDLGSVTTMPIHFDREMNALGIKTLKFNPFRPLLDIRMNNRDHRKILVIDGHTCFSGGFNLGDEYINKEQRFGHWKDNAILIKGRAVSNFTYMFLANWVSSGFPDEQIDKDYYDSKTFIDEIGGYPEDDGFVSPYGDIPFHDEAVGERVYLSLIAQARDYIYITTPYLIIDSEMQNHLCQAARSGVDVRLLTPHIPDKKAVFSVTRSYYGPLLEAGVKVYEYTPGFVHEKTFICDGRMATVGTFNLDYRSLYLHLECGTFMVGCSAIEDMKRDYDDTIALSQPITLADYQRWRKRAVWYWNILRILGPIL